MSNKADFDNIVFEDRNKAYGAFYLRKFYKNSILMGFIIAALVVTAGLSAPLAFTLLKGDDENAEQETAIIVDMVDVEVPEVEIPLPEPPPEPEVATLKNLELEVKPDKEVKDETPPPTDDELTDKQSGKENKEGLNTPTVPPPPPPPAPSAPEPPKIETWAPEMPEFPGGPSELLKFFNKHLTYTPAAEENNIQGSVRVSFIVNVDGTITDVKIVKGLGYGLDEQVLKAFKKMPKWKPARKGGKEVPLRMFSPVVFTLTE